MAELLVVVDLDVALGADGSSPVQDGGLVGEHDDVSFGGVLATIEVADIYGGDLRIKRLSVNKIEQLDSS